MQLGLTRRLKRALQDEHNGLLDRLRASRGEASIGDVIGSRDDQAERYTLEARPFVERAAAAGLGFLVATSGDGRKDRAPAARALSELVAGIVDPLRSRIEAVLEERADDPEDVLADALAAVYRQARSRLEGLVADCVSAAHSEAAWRSVPAGVALRWVADDADGPCPDCDDNSLAGPVPKGEPFPTGQLHPPAHRGCHCLLVLDGE